MTTRKMAAITAVLLLHRLAFADASYQSTTQINGGQLMDTMMKMPFLSKTMKESFAPTSTITMVHGNQKASVGKDRTEIYDIDKQEIISIDNVKKTYSILTFAEMRQMMVTMPEKMKEAEAKIKQAQGQQPQSQMQTTVSAKVNNTGISKVVNGLTAQEQIITVTTTMTLPPPGPNSPPPDPANPMPTTIDFTVTTDAWIAPDPPEIKEIQDFDMRMGKKMMEGVDPKLMAEQMKQMQAGGQAMAQMLGAKPGAADAMAEMGKEMAKIKGTRVLEITTMGGMGAAGMPGAPPAGQAAAAPIPPPPSGGSVAGQVASDTATQTAAGESSKMGVFGSALSNSALNAFHRKKATPPPPPAPVATTPPPAPGTPGAPAPQGAMLVSTTNQKTNFSQEPVPTSVFQIPAGFKQVESPMAKMAK